MGAWIETFKSTWERYCTYVAPHVGAWIETSMTQKSQKSLLSLPMWERGLKLGRLPEKQYGNEVAPHVGAWIETQPHQCRTYCQNVAPHVGAWIETISGGTQPDG